MFSPETQSGNLKIAHGTWTTVAASDDLTFNTHGLRGIVAAAVCLQDDPVAGVQWVTCSFSGGTLTVKTWKATAAGDTAPTAATTFSKKVNYILVGY